ncbi:MAG: hypothetical protein ACI9TH_001288 [Kiritimatiellia bacterium]|jgi:hypothetical protein
MKRLSAILLILLTGATSAWARYNWEDVNGNKLIAEFVQKTGSIVTLRTEAGTIRRVNFSRLVKKDQDYITQQTAIPARRLGDKKFGEAVQMGTRDAAPQPVRPAASGGSSAADKANAQIAAYRAQKEAEEEARRKKTEEAKERFRKQMADRKKSSNRRR